MMTTLPEFLKIAKEAIHREDGPKLRKIRELLKAVDSFDDLEWVRRHAGNSRLRREVLEDLDYSDMCDIIEGYWQLVQKLEKLMNEQN